MKRKISTLLLTFALAGCYGSVPAVTDSADRERFLQLARKNVVCTELERGSCMCCNNLPFTAQCDWGKNASVFIVSCEVMRNAQFTVLK